MLINNRNQNVSIVGIWSFGFRNFDFFSNVMWEKNIRFLKQQQK